MQARFESHQPQAIEQRNLTGRRAGFVLRRLGGLLPRLEVRVADVNGPSGGLDKRCPVELRIDE